MSKTFKPPKSAINNAKKGLEFRKKYGRGGLTPAEAKSYGIDSGITRAKRIASGNLSKHDVRRMSAFNRHRGNYNPSKKMADGGPTAGTIAWLLWGGTSGVNWAKKKSAAMGAESFEADCDDFYNLPTKTKRIAVNIANTQLNKNYGKVSSVKLENAEDLIAKYENKGLTHGMAWEQAMKEGGLWDVLMDGVNICAIRYGDADFYDENNDQYNLHLIEGDFDAESFEADDDVFTHSVVLGFKFKYYTKQNPIYKKKEDGSFNLDPIHIVKLKILILREMDLVGVEYDDATITADSLLFKFNFTNEIEAQKFSSYVREYLSQNEKVEQLQEYFDTADARVMTKYEAGILFSTLMDWSNKEYLIDFLEYLLKLEEYDYDYSLQYIRERGVDINEQDDYGVSLKDLMLAEKMGYQSMLEELVNDLKNKGRRLDDVAFTLSADNGLKNQTRTSMFAIQQAVESGVVNKTMSLQYLRYEGKLEAINQFLYYVYGDEDTFIFNNI